MDEFWKTAIPVITTLVGVAIAQFTVGYIAKLRAPSQNRKDEADARKSYADALKSESDAASIIFKSAEALTKLYEEQFTKQQKELEELKHAFEHGKAVQLQNQRRILELESQDRSKSEKIETLEKSDSQKAAEILSLKQELVALYDYIALIEKWARENKLSLPTKNRRTDGAEHKAQ